MQLESLQGLGHNASMAPESSSNRPEASFRNLLNSQDSNPDPAQGLRSLSHPNLTNIPTRTLPSMTQSSPNLPPTHSQTPISFPAHLGSFALSSMVGHFTHPQLQPPMNPAGGLMPSLGVSVGPNQSISNNLAHGLSLCSSSISIMNAPMVSISTGQGGGGGVRGSGGRGGSQGSVPMPLTHHITGNLQNPSSLPLIPGMPSMYSYPYTAAAAAAAATTTLPPTAASNTSSVVYPNAPAGFPSQSLMPAGYPQYISPSLYGNAPQPPTSAHQGNFPRR